ncbi:MAG: ScyD/ScyE family protein [Actinomycetota bacterium]
MGEYTAERGAPRRRVTSSRTSRWRKLAIVAGLLLATTGLSAVGVEADTGGVQEPSGIVASGLDNPRHLEVARNGRIWVSEAGSGGSTLVDTALGGSPGPICVGDSGAVSVIVRGEVRRVVTGLASASDAVDGSCDGTGAFATGPHGLDVTTSDPTYSTGLGGVGAIRDLLAAGDPVASHFGTVDNMERPQFQLADLVAFEDANDTDGSGADSNPYGVLRIPGGTTLVADAGANAILAIDATGGISPHAVFAPRCVPWNLPFPNPVPPVFNPCGTQDEFPADPVPTGVARAMNGDILVSTLGGFPFAAGFSLIYRIDADHDGVAVCSTFAPVPASGCEVFADGLTSLVDLEVAPDGKVYAVQFADAGVGALESGAPGATAGSVQILHRRTGEVMGSIVGLTLPGGVAIDGRDVYITNNSVFPGAGEIVEARTLCTTLGKAACLAG